VFAGAGARYTFNQIFLDGNTWHDSRSIDYDPEQVAVSIGLAYSWENLSMTFAINDLNVIGDEDKNVDQYTQYGTLTLHGGINQQFWGQ
jgi:lipid A 3-O-deacylase